MNTAARRSPEQYDPTTVALHWGVAFGVIFQWFGAHAIDWFAPGWARVDARSAHILVGTALTAGVALRLWWRARRGVRLPRDHRPEFAVAAGVTHALLHALLGAVLGLGVFNTWVRGDSILGWFHIPPFGDFAHDARHALANRVVGLHRLAANLILGVAAAHACAGLAHHFWLADGVLRRMLPMAAPRAVRRSVAVRRSELGSGPTHDRS